MSNKSLACQRVELSTNRVANNSLKRCVMGPRASILLRSRSDMEGISASPSKFAATRYVEICSFQYRRRATLRFCSLRRFNDLN